MTTGDGGRALRLERWRGLGEIGEAEAAREGDAEEGVTQRGDGRRGSITEELLSLAMRVGGGGRWERGDPARGRD